MKKFSLKFIIIFSFIYGALLFLVFANLGRFTNDALFTWDSREYQSVAVNFAMGHGFPKFGAIESFDKYHFEDLNKIPDEIKIKYLDEFNRWGGKDTFVRAPAYAFFLGTAYKLFGISPLLIKYLQLLMLVIIAVSLPWLGRYFFKQIGLLSGLMAGPIFLATSYRYAQFLISECLISFTIFLAILAFIYFERKRNSFSALILGLIIGFSLLVKGAFIFLPLIIIGYLIYRIIKTYEKLSRLLIVFGSIILIVFSWSAYASLKSNRLVILTTQGGELFAAGNSDCITNGHWNNYCYTLGLGTSDLDKSDKYIDPAYSVKAILLFNIRNPHFLIKNVLHKIVGGLAPFFFLWVIIWIIIFDKLNRVLENKKYYLYYLIISIPVLALLLAASYAVSQNHELLYLWWSKNIISKAVGIIMALLIFTLIFLKSKSTDFKIPNIFIIIFLSFFLLNIFLYVDDAVYDSRYVKVMDFIFVLTGITYLIYYLDKIYRQLQRSFSAPNSDKVIK